MVCPRRRTDLERKKAPSWLGLGIGFALGAVMGALSGWSDIGIVLAPAFLGFALGAWGYAAGAVSFVGFIGALFLICGLESTLLRLAAVLPASAVIGYIIYNKKAWRTAVGLGALLMGVGLYVYTCLPSILDGYDPFYYIASVFTALAEEMTSLAESGLVSEERVSLMRAMFVTLADSVETIAMQAICLISMVFALVDTLIARLLVKRTGRELKPMTPMPLWQLSSNYTYAALAAIVGGAAALLFELNNSASVVSAAQMAIIGPLALMGVCYLDFTTRLGRPGSKAKRVIIYVLIVIMLPYSITVLAIAGLLDRIMKTRRRFVPNEKRKKPNNK